MKKLLLISAAAILSFQANAQEFDPTFDGDGWRQDTIGPGTSSAQAYHDAVVRPDGKLVVSGLYEASGFSQDISVARYNTDGTLDNSFGNNGKVYLTFNAANTFYSKLAQNAAGELFLLGSADGPFHICRLSPNGTIDNSFGTNGVMKDSLLTGAADGF